MSLDIKLGAIDRVYRPEETVTGVVVVSTKGSLSHTGINLIMQGEVTLQLSAKSVGLFDAFYNSLKPIQLLYYTCEVAKPGKIPDGVTELPFEFKLTPLPNQTLYETYHGVFVNIQYSLQADMTRPLLAKNLQKRLEFIVEGRETVTQNPKPPKEVPFVLTPEEVKKVTIEKVPNFRITGKLNTAVCHISKPFTGDLCIESCDTPIKTIELQLVRVETCGCADGYAKEATEIQNIQIGEGDVVSGLTIPIYMIFPRLFTCPTLATKTFKIEFEINLVIMFHDGAIRNENFPIRIVR